VKSNRAVSGAGVRYSRRTRGSGVVAGPATRGDIAVARPGARWVAVPDRCPFANPDGVSAGVDLSVLGEWRGAYRRWGNRAPPDHARLPGGPATHGAGP